MITNVLATLFPPVLLFLLIPARHYRLRLNLSSSRVLLASSMLLKPFNFLIHHFILFWSSDLTSFLYGEILERKLRSWCKETLWRGFKKMEICCFRRQESSPEVSNGCWSCQKSWSWKETSKSPGQTLQCLLVIFLVI